MSLTVGRKGRAETTVVHENTAAAVGSGLAEVFATPMMVALMEGAAVDALESCLAPGEGSVGTHIDVTHDAATPVGMKVWAEAELTAVEGRVLTFAVRAYDEAGPIGGGTHRRVIIDNERFMSKVERKKVGM